MKQMLDLNALAAEVQRQSESKADYVADTRRISLGEDDKRPVVMTVDGVGDDGGLGEFAIRPHAHTQLGGWASIPKPYYDRMLEGAPGLLVQNVNHWLREQPAKRMLRTLDGDLRAFVSDRYRRLDNFDLAGAVLPILGEMPDVRFESCGLTETRMYLKAILPRIEGEIKVGDAVCSGVVVSNSEVGAGSLSVETLVYRLVCSNGMISGVSLRKYHTGKRVEESEDALGVFRDETLAADDKAFFMKVADLVRAACDEARFQEIIAACREKADIRVEGDPVKAVERLANRHGLSEAEQGGVLQHLIEGGDLTQWGFINAVTRASQDVESYDRATELERLGGTLVQLPAPDWAALAAA